jgi:hypothetical protein
MSLAHAKASRKAKSVDMQDDDDDDDNNNNSSNNNALSCQ